MKARRGATAVLVVDVQNASVTPDLPRAADVLDAIARVIGAARAGGVEVVHVRHEDPPGEPWAPGTIGWAFHPAAAPADGERVIPKRWNSAFRGSGLADYLDERGVGRLVVVGLHTEYCVDTTVRVAFELGYDVVVPEGANGVMARGAIDAELLHRHYNREIWAGRFAEVCSVEEAVARLERGWRREGGGGVEGRRFS